MPVSNRRSEKLFGRDFDFDETYFVAFFGGPRYMTRKELEEYDIANGMPDQLRVRILARMDPKKNPNYHPHSGLKLLEIMLDQGYIPMFDRLFEKNKKLTLVHVYAYEWYEKHHRKRQKELRER